MKRKNTNLILIGLLLVYLFFELFLWVKTDGLPGMMDQAETYITYLGGKNLVRYGIVQERFIEDYAMSHSAGTHPYYFTHNPDFPVLVTYFLQKIGLTSLPAQNFLTIFILGLGLFYMFLTIKEYTESTEAGLFVLGVSVFTYAGVLVYGLNIFRGWSWLILFGNIYHLKKYADENKQKDFILGILFFFLMAYYDYILTIFVSIIILLFKLFKFYDKLSFKHLILYGILGTVPAFILHKILLIWALGWDTFAQDIYFTFAKRISGNPVIMEKMKEFYPAHGIVLWEAPQVKADWAYLKEIFTSGAARLSIVFGALYLRLLAVFFTICLLKTILKVISFSFTFKFKEKIFFLHTNEKEITVFTVFGLATSLICLVFPLYVNAIFVGPLAPFFVFAITLGGGILFSFLFTNFLSGIKNKSPGTAVISAIILGLSAIYLVRLDYIHLTKTTPAQPMPGHKALAKYKGRSFVTNYQSSYINYFTDQWAKMVWWNIGTLNIEDVRQRDVINAYLSDKFIRRNEYVFEKDRLINNAQYEKPDFLFITNMWAYPYFANPEETFKKYPLAEKGNNFWIFDLRIMD